MLDRRFIRCTASLMLLVALRTLAQHDTTCIGVGGEETEYAETTTGPLDAMTSTTYMWDVNDSLQAIPCYDLYCGWNTNVIFPTRGDHQGKADHLLQLSTSACDHAVPVCGVLNSDFGPRRGRMHYGVDIDLETGDPVVSAFEGVVRVSRQHRTFGNVVVIRHWNGLETLYAHLSRRWVNAGDGVMAGDTIGLGGSTGRSTGSHLHFETRYLGRPIDPKFIFEMGEGTLKNSTLAVHNGLFEAVSGARSYHIVRRGESLSAISRRYGVGVNQLCRLNRLSARSTLRIGQHIRYR